MARETPCQTPGVIYNVSIYDLTRQESPKTVVDTSTILPFVLDLSEEEAELLEDNIHNALELVLRPYFPKSKK